MTEEVTIHFEDLISTKTLRHELHKSNIHSRAAIVKLLLTESNAQMHKQWCHNHKTWISDNWKCMRYSQDEFSFMLFATSGRVYVWRTLKEAYNPECLAPIVKHGGGSVMVWIAVSCPIITLHG
jgi:hypothetical protein